MSRIATAAAAILCTLAAPLAAQSSFEGIVKAEMHTARQETMQVTFTSKGPQTRMDVVGGPLPMYSITDMNTQTTTMVVPPQKMYMTMDMAAAIEQGAAQEQKAPKIEKVGKSETIAGYTCEHYLIGEGEEKVDVCTTPRLGLLGFNGSMGGGPMGRRGRSSPALERAMKEFKDGFFPLKLERVKPDGTRELMLLVTEVVPARVDPKVFAVPEGFQKIEMPAGMPPMQRQP